MKMHVFAQYEAGDLFGLPSVLVENVAALRCSRCDEVLLAGKLIDELGAALVRQLLLGTFPLGGCEIRFLRKAMGLTQQVLADRLGVGRVTVARWEAEELEDVDMPLSIAIRTVLGAAEKSPLSSPPPAENFRNAPVEHPRPLRLRAPTEVAV